MNKANNEDIGHILGAFISEYGVPEHLTYDGAAVKLESKTISQNHVRKYDIQTQRSAPRRPNENPCEGYICEIEKKWYQIQEKKKIPDTLWDYGIDYICETENMTVNSFIYYNVRTPLEIIKGKTKYVSEYLDYDSMTRSPTETILDSDYPK